MKKFGLVGVFVCGFVLCNSFSFAISEVKAQTDNCLETSLRNKVVDMMQRQEPGKKVTDFHILFTRRIQNISYAYGRWRLNGEENEVTSVIEQNSVSGTFRILGLGTSAMSVGEPLSYSMAGTSQNTFLTGSINSESIVKIKIYVAGEEIVQVPVFDSKYFVAVAPINMDKRNKIRVQGLDRKNHVVFDSGRKTKS